MWMPFQALRIDDTLLLALPWEVTTQAGVRIRAAAAAASGVRYVVVVGMANEYGGYLTTPEEYTAQRYEGQMTWWGPEQADWVAAASARAAAAAVDGRVLRAPLRDGAPGSSNSSPLSQAAAVVRDPAGQVLSAPAEQARPGDELAMSWTGGDPSVDAAREQPFVTVERRRGTSWVPVVADGDGAVLIRFARTGTANAWSATWRLPRDADGGSYRFRVTGWAYDGAGTSPYVVESAPVRVTD
jgi:neutral ceramidase